MIRQQDRGNHDDSAVGAFADIGQQMTWRPWRDHTAMLLDNARASCDYASPRSAVTRPGRSPPGWRPRTGRLTRPAAVDHLGQTGVMSQWTELNQDPAGRLITPEGRIGCRAGWTKALSHTEIEGLALQHHQAPRTATTSNLEPACEEPIGHGPCPVAI